MGAAFIVERFFGSAYSTQLFRPNEVVMLQIFAHFFFHKNFLGALFVDLNYEN